MERLSPKAIYALVIGIDHYLPNPLCEPLHGAVADAGAMAGFLRARGVPSANLVKLTASRGPDGSPAEPPEKRPTYESMIAAIRRLGEAAAKVDGGLVVHYSGHGCRTPTLLPATKGAGGFDEGLLPYDVADPEARILRDVEISYLLAELAGNGVAVVLVLDACHSGGVLRDESLVRVRSARRVDPIVRRRDSDVASAKLLEESWRRLHQQAFSTLVPASIDGSPPISRDAAPFAVRLGPTASLIAACRAHEAAYELPYDGAIRGALTCALLETLAQGETMPTWERLQRRVTRRIQGLGLHQTPIFEGAPSETLLGFLRRGAHRTLRVVSVDRQRNQVLLDAGRSFGLGRGARLEIVSGDGRESGSGPLLVEIEANDASTAKARLRAGELTDVTSGDRAFLIDPGASRRRRVQVAIPVPEPALRGALSEGSVLRDGRLRGHFESPLYCLHAVERALDARPGGFLEKAPVGPTGSDSIPDFRVVLGRGNAYEVLEIDGCPVPHLPPLPATSPGAAARVVDRLNHLARFYAVRDLENHDTRGLARGSLSAELGRLPRNFVLGEDLDSEPCTEARPRFDAGAGLCLSIVNHSSLTLHLYVLDLRPDWSVRLLHPRRGVETLLPDQSIRLPFKVSLPAGIRQGLETFKIVATTRPTNAGWLELPAIDRLAPVDKFRSEPSVDSPESFFAAMLGQVQRSSAPRGTAGVWIADQVDFEVGEADVGEK